MYKKEDKNEERNKRQKSYNNKQKNSIKIFIHLKHTVKCSDDLESLYPLQNRRDKHTHIHKTPKPNWFIGR